MITAAQVADLQPGDVVEFSGHPMLRGAALTGPLYRCGRGDLSVGDYVVRYANGGVNMSYGDRLALTVVSRTPRLYVNHPRTWPAVGDILRDCDGDAWLRGNGEWFCATAEEAGPCGPEYFTPLRLLWDGENGRCVQ